GLIEAIPEATILEYFFHPPDGVSGVPNMVFNPESGNSEVGRFGWKAQVPTLHLFAGDAYLNEMGITNPTFPNENLPQGRPIPDGCDLVPGLEDNGDGVIAFANFMRFLAPLAPVAQTSQTQRGFGVFQAIGCAACHRPSMTTGDNPVPALNHQTVNLFSDLLL